MSRFEAVTGYYEVPGSSPERRSGALYDAETDELLWEPNPGTPVRRTSDYWKGRERDSVVWRLTSNHSVIPINYEAECAECGKLLTEVDYLCDQCRTANGNANEYANGRSPLGAAR